MISVNVKSVAFPKEHGGWVMTVEALIVGLGLNPSPAAFCLGALALLGFLLVNPARIWLRDRAEGKSYPRTQLAARFAAGYGAGILLLLAAAVMINRQPFWVPLAAAAALFGVDMFFALNRQDKHLLSQICGGLATGAVAAAILIAGGCSVSLAVAVWIILGVRAVTSIVYIRQKLRQTRGQDHSRAVVAAVHLLGAVVLAAAGQMHGVPSMIWVMYALLCVRAVAGMETQKSVRPQVVGVQEMILGLCNSAVIVWGYFPGAVP